MPKADILIIEDQNTAALDLERRLRRLGYAALGIAVSPRKAIQRAHEVRPDLVMMAVGGDAALSDVKAAEAYRTRLPAPALYLIGDSDEELLRSAQGIAPFGYLVTPCDAWKLSSTVQMALHAHRMERALRESERRYRLLAETVSDVIWATDFELLTTYVTPAVSRLLGYDLEETLQSGMVGRLTPASLEVARRTSANLRAAARQESGDSDATKTLELAFISQDGVTTWTDVQASLLRDASGRPSALLWVIRGRREGGWAARRSRLQRRYAGADRGELGELTRAETALRETSQELESCLQERIVQLERTQSELARALEERKRAESKLGELNREWLSLQSAAAATASSLDLQFVLETVTWEMAELLTVEGCAVFQWNRDADTISVIADYASSRLKGPQAVGKTHSLSDYPLRTRVLTERYAQQVTIDEVDGGSGERAYMARNEIESMLMLPMVYHDRVIGLVELRSCQAHRRFSDREISLAQMLSTEAASAIENARLYRRSQREIAHRMRVEEELKASLREKEALLQEIHHRVKNNLQVICSLLNLQSRSIEDQDALQMFRESQDRVRSMALIHEKLYRSDDMARIDFSDYLRNLTNHLVRSYRPDPDQVTLSISADDVPLDLEKAVPCGLITNELISNAMKHAFPDGQAGEIQVTLRANGDQRLTLSVADNGVGLPADLDVETSETLGLQLIRVLTSQLGGTTEMHSSPGNGTEVHVTFSAS